MDDNAILDLYFARSEQAILETDRKYGSYCYSIANHILLSPPDAEESVNDAYYTAWKLIPPRRPQRFGPFLGKLTRNLSIDRWRKNTAGKRGGGETQLLLDELAECVTGAESPETDLLRKELSAALNRFLRALPGHFKAQKARVYRHSNFGCAAGLRAVADSAGENRQAVYHRVIDEDLVRPVQVGDSRRRSTACADRSAVGGQVADRLLDAHCHQVCQHQGPPKKESVFAIGPIPTVQVLR